MLDQILSDYFEVNNEISIFKFNAMNYGSLVWFLRALNIELKHALFAKTRKKLNDEEVSFEETEESQTVDELAKITVKYIKLIKQAGKKQEKLKMIFVIDEIDNFSKSMETNN